MAFVVESGTGLSNATSYVSVADADAYFLDRGSSAWAALSNGEKEVALVQATSYVDAVNSFIGTKSTSAQSLQWPRSSAYDRDGYLYEGIPSCLEHAIAEYALRASSTSLAPDIEYSSTGILTMEKSQVGPVMEEKRYSDQRTPAIREYPYADALLAPLVVPRGTIYRG
jgi:hypothetical protein